jgi:hypothetical protein
MSDATQARIEGMARDIAKVCFTNGIFLDGCGCCGTLRYKSKDGTYTDFDMLTVEENGTVQGSALVEEPGREMRVRVKFKFIVSAEGV